MSPNKRDKGNVRKQIDNEIIVASFTEDPVNKKPRKPFKKLVSGASGGFWSIAEFNTGYFFIKESLGRIAILPINSEGEIALTGFHFEGYVQNRRFCSKCQHFQLFDIDHDSHFCPLCNIWLEGTCDDPECGFCPTRPEKPMPTFGVDEDTYPPRSRGGWGRYYWIKVDAEIP